MMSAKRRLASCLLSPCCSREVLFVVVVVVVVVVAVMFLFAVAGCGELDWPNCSLQS